LGFCFIQQLGVEEPFIIILPAFAGQAVPIKMRDK